MAFFHAYFDASGTNKTRVITMAGFVARIARWESFEAHWRALLPPTVDMFHMTDFVSSKDGWESWKGQPNTERRKALIGTLASCIKSKTNKGFTVSLCKKHYLDCDKEYKLTERFKHPYVVVGMGCLGSLNAWAKKKEISQSNILCVFEDGDEGQAELIEMARSEGFNAVPQSKKEIRAFDACDLAGWKARTIVDDIWERELQLKYPHSAGMLERSLDVLEDVVKSAKGAGMLSLEGLRNSCKQLGIPTR